MKRYILFAGEWAEGISHMEFQGANAVVGSFHEEPDLEDCAAGCEPYDHWMHLYDVVENKILWEARNESDEFDPDWVIYWRYGD